MDLGSFTGIKWEMNVGQILQICSVLIPFGVIYNKMMVRNILHARDIIDLKEKVDRIENTISQLPQLFLSAARVDDRRRRYASPEPADDDRLTEIMEALKRLAPGE
jgi:hypothetical protein